jgi:hypothetical protein
MWGGRGNADEGKGVDRRGAEGAARAGRAGPSAVASVVGFCYNELTRDTELRSAMAVLDEREAEEWGEAAAADEPFMEGWERPSVDLGARAKRGLLNLFGLTDSVGQAAGESWPLVVIGLLGAALFFGGLVVLVYGW